MTLHVYGLNHKTADLALREKVAFNQAAQVRMLSALLSHADISQAVVLSTCNRTEFYCDTDSVEPIVEVLLETCPLVRDELEQYFYQYHGESGIEHIMQVACGLDSMVLGEPQILGQLKSAVNIAFEQKSLGPSFHELFQSVFQLAKRVRTTTEIGVCPVSIASLAVKLAEQVFTSLKGSRALLVGAGDTMRLVAIHLRQSGIEHITIASRNIENASRIASHCQGRAVAITHLAEHLPQADIIMSATASELPIIGKGAIETALQQRGHRPMFMVDMAVPRDIEHEVSELDAVHLYTIDDLKLIAQESVQVREHAAEQANKIIVEQTDEYMKWLQVRESIDIVRGFREHVETLREQELAKAMTMLKTGSCPAEALQRLANNLTNKIMHQPSVSLKAASEDGRDDILNAVIDLFALDK